MSLIQQALKRQQDEAKGKIVLPPPHLGSTQLAVKPHEPVKPPLFAPAPPVNPPVRPADVDAAAPHQKMKLANSPDQPASASVNVPPVPPIFHQAEIEEPQSTQPAAQSEPVPLPPVLIEPPQEEKSSGLKASRLLILLLIVAFAVYWFYWRPNHTTSVAAPVGTGAPAAKTDVNAGEAVVKHIGPFPDIHDIKTKVDAMKAKVEVEHADRAVMNTGLDVPVAEKPVVVTPPAPATVVTVQPEVKPVVVVSKAKPVVNAVWPSIQINGVMPRDVKSQASAIINGNLVSVGESIEGMTLIEVQERGVKMDFKGEEKFLSIGRH